MSPPAFASSTIGRCASPPSNVALTRRFLTAHGVHDYLIVESPGATEGAPAAGTAELIVDITSTGQTLVENGLKIVDDGIIMRSEAALAASLAAPWTEAARTACRGMLTRIAADDRARSVRRIDAVMQPSSVLPEELRARTDLTLLSLHDEGLSLLVPKPHAQAEAEALIARGATDGHCLVSGICVRGEERTLREARGQVGLT